jgi:uncharacterized membrane protein
MYFFLFVILVVLILQILSLRKRISKLEKLQQTTPVTPSPESVHRFEEAKKKEPIIPETKEDHKEISMQISQPEPETQAVTSPADHATETGPSEERKKGGAFNTVTESIEMGVDYIKKFFTTGNVVLKVGIIILFFGVAFLLKYVAQRNLISLEFRLAIIATGGLALLLTGWCLRKRALLYGLALQGGGIGIIYLTVFASSKLYHLLPIPLTLVIMICLVAFTGALAVLQDSKSLAIFGIVGGFMAPVLMSTGSGSHVMLFSYYALLNAGILFIAWFRAWRELNLLGFIFTFAVSAFWGHKYYHPAYFTTTEPFLILFFMFYVAISILFAHRQPPKLKGFIDGPLVFGLPLAVFSLQARLVSDMEYGLAISVLALGISYILLATFLWRRLTQGMRMLTEAFLALGVVFGSLAIPLALDGHWTATAWALEGAAMVWVGIHQARLLARLFGILLQIGAGMAFLSESGYPSWEMVLFLNRITLSCFFLSISGLFSSYYLALHHGKLRDWETRIHIPLMVWGLLWWFGGGIGDIERHIPHKDFYSFVLLFCAMSCLVMATIAQRLKWQEFKYPLLGLLPLMIVIIHFSWPDFSSHMHLFARWGSLAWVLSLLIQYGLLRMFEDEWPEKIRPYWHLATMWLVLFIATHEIAWAVQWFIHGSQIWPIICWGIVPGCAMLLMMNAGKRMGWPVKKYYSHYLDNGIIIPMFFLVLWELNTDFSSGDPAPISYLPILNPLELSQLFVFFVLFRWALHNKIQPHSLFENLPDQTIPCIVGACIFIWLNCVVGRIVHFYTTIPFQYWDLYGSVVFQSAISILWTVSALAVTIWATRHLTRRIWFAGATLLAMVVLKLFTVDLSGIGTIARIVSFIAVGILMLLIGYFSPLPPKIREEI